MADPALAEPAAAHPKLAHPAARLRLRRRDPPVRAPGDPGRRRTRPAAPPLPRPRRLLVAARHGVLAERYDQVDDLTRARHLPSPQLTGTPQAATTDLNALTAQGVRIVGRLGRVINGAAQFSGSLANTCTLADLKMNRFLDRADEWAAASGFDGELPVPHRFAPTRVDPRSPLELDLSSGEITTVLWATGFRPDHSWLDIPVRDRTGHIRHDGGVVTAPPDSTSSACRWSAPAPPPTSTAQPPTPKPWPTTSTRS